MNINWKQKLSSRKFWAYLSGLVVAIVLIFNSESDTTQIVALIAAIGDIAVYILGESWVDANRNSDITTDINTDTKTEISTDTNSIVIHQLADKKQE